MRDEVRPPGWALSGAERLDLEGFGRAFITHWRRARSGLVKVECWQSYEEPDTKSLHEYQRGNYAAVGDLLEAEADLDQEVYDDAKNGKPFIRVRFVKLPLTEYLAFEMWNYVVRERRGERVEIVDLSTDDRPLPNYDHFDFLLFDGTAALIHDYGTTGCQTGGWSTTSAETVGRLTAIGEDARRRAEPLATFLARQRIKIPS